MKIEKELAKNGEYTLKINDKYIYSKYSPRLDAEKWIKRQVNIQAEEYVLVGFGLGYHLEALVAEVGLKPVQVWSLFSEHEQWGYECQKENVQIISNIRMLKFSEQAQILIPQVWLTLLPDTHPLYSTLSDIKMKQVSYNRFATKMQENFLHNIKESYIPLSVYKDCMDWSTNKAFLVASGPSLSETMIYIKKYQEKAYILSVGSALKPLLANGIIPNGVIISDCQNQIYEQMKETQYQGDLFYLSTANNLTVIAHNGRKILLLQHGYRLAEQYAAEINEVLLETGASVATTAFSLLEELGFKEVYLFGQDLAITKSATHVVGSTSNRQVLVNEKMHFVESNLGDLVQSLPNLMSYLKWFEQKISKSHVVVYNTAEKGAKIQGTSFIKKDEIGNKLRI